MGGYFSRMRKLGLLIPILVLSVCLLLLGSCEFLPIAEPPVFGVKSGFYKEPFRLEIVVPDGCRVYYTLDGSIPNKQSHLYREPILIENASLNPNTISNISGMSIQNHAKKPDFLIDKCTVIRAIAISEENKWMQHSEVVTKSYFVGFDEGYFDGCGIISLVTEPENFFDGEKGIYVMGDALEEYLASTEEPNEEIVYSLSNYFKRGSEWERDVSLSLFSEDGSLIEEKDGGVRIQGAASRVLVPRGLNLFARDSNGDAGYFKKGYFDNGYTPDAMTLSAGGNQYTTLFNDFFISSRTNGLSFATMTYKPYVLFLNGEYWGFYWLTEKYNENYIKYTYSIPDSEIIMIKNEEVSEGYDNDLSVFSRVVEYVKGNDLSDDEKYRRACELIDVNSFVDYYATMVYIARCSDWPGYNEAMWRTREISEMPYADGKWRWLMFDCNSASMWTDLIEHNTLQYVIEESPLFGAFWENEHFREKFEKRILEIADMCFNERDVQNVIDEYKANMVPALSKSWARFLGKDYSWSFERFVNILDGQEMFFMKRRAVVESWFS